MRTNYFNKQITLYDIFYKLERENNELIFKLSNCYVLVSFDELKQEFILDFTEDIIVLPDIKVFLRFDNLEFQTLVDRTVSNYSINFD
ncbi:hypothetical protein [Anaerococcus hydrogenalis]|uniref:hypothetical protein n=1 Tax=Anaerococcus hydrogenalis TaxID=33029 RepID=UPI0028FE5102|nr:hypothetical protein [Anaerococcus hydrogenalis]MDU1317130.1 hypothetical protein [Anaerococcus hydrogenalis]